MSFLSSLWSLFATKVVVILGFVYATFYHSVMGTRIQTFERKHGRWKFARILPMFLMVMSCINVTTVQAASLHVHSARPIKSKSPHVSSIHLAFLFDKWKESLDKRSDFDKLLDSIDPPQSFSVGPNYANDWEEYLAHEAFRRSCQGEFAEDLDIDISDVNPPIFTPSQDSVFGLDGVDILDDIIHLSSSVTISHLPEDISSELESLLVQLPRNQVCLYPASLASAELLPKLPHLLRSAGPQRDQEFDFGILLDTGCSVATTGFEEDFCGQLAYGRFGVIKTADGMAEIKGFGMVHWETMDTDGNMVLIKVPAYYVPTVEMRLLFHATPSCNS